MAFNVLGGVIELIDHTLNPPRRRRTTDIYTGLRFPKYRRSRKLAAYDRQYDKVRKAREKREAAKTKYERTKSAKDYDAWQRSKKNYDREFQKWIAMPIA